MVGIDTIEQMIRQVPLYATGWEICRGGTVTDLDGNTKITKSSFLVIKPINPTAPSATPTPDERS